MPGRCRTDPNYRSYRLSVAAIVLTTPSRCKEASMDDRLFWTVIGLSLAFVAYAVYDLMPAFLKLAAY